MRTGGAEAVCRVVAEGQRDRGVALGERLRATLGSLTDVTIADDPARQMGSSHVVVVRSSAGRSVDVVAVEDSGTFLVHPDQTP